MMNIKRRGSVMLTVIFVFASLLILSTVMVTTARNERMGSIRENFTTQAYYMARSGAETAAKAVIDNTASAWTILKSNQTVTTTGAIGAGSFSAVSTWDSANRTVKIVSTGTYRNFSAQATLNLNEQDFSETVTLKTAGDMFASAIYNSSLTLLDLQKATIEGAIGSLGEIIPPDGFDPSLVFKNSTRVLPDIIVPVVPKASPYNISKNPKIITTSEKFGTISLMNDTLIIDTTHGDINLVVDSMYLKNNLEIRGNNRVSIFVLHDITLQTPQIINNSDPRKFIIYLAPGSKGDIQANTLVNAYIYGPNAEITMNASSTILRGAIIGNVFNIGHQSVVYVPIAGDDFNLSITETTYTVKLTELKKGLWE